MTPSLRLLALATTTAIACNDVTPPTSVVTAPPPSSTVGGTIKLEAAASDDSAVARVEMMIDGKLVATEKETPYSATFDTKTLQDGAHTLVAIAFDEKGNKTASAPVSFSVKNVVQPPVDPPTPPVAGWTDFKLAPDAIKIHVSSSLGLDSNDGSESKPLKTLKAAYSKLRNGKPDHLVLKRGDTFKEAFPYWEKSGRSATEPMVIGAYGAGTARPVVSSDGNVLSTRSNISFIAVQGLRFTSLNREPGSSTFNTNVSSDAAIRWMSRGQFLLLEDMLIDFHRVGIVSEQPEAQMEGAPKGWTKCASYFKNLKIRRSVIANNWSYPSTTEARKGGHSQGAYLQCVDGLTMEENFWDSNGYHKAVSGAVPTQFNHNVYLNAKSKNVVAKGNVFSRGAATGIQVRTGGIFENNLVVQNPQGITYGIVRGGNNPEDPQVVQGGVTGTIKGNVFLEGVDLDANNPRALAAQIGNLKDVEMSDNVFAHYSHIGKPYNHGSVAIDCGNGIGLGKLVMKNNATWKWEPWLTTSGPCKNKPEESGTVKTKAMEKKLADYAPDFFEGARKQSRLTWNQKYTATEAVKYFRAQFGK